MTDNTSSGPPHGEDVAGVDHVFLTRFNLPSPGVESLIRAQEGWLRDRVALFERYTLPSMGAQTIRSFSWVVYFDPESPAWLLEKIRSWTSHGVLTALFRESVPTATLLADLAEVSRRRHGDLLTTNLDNDDGLAIDFAERLQRAARTGDATAVYYVNGLIKSETGVYRRVDRRNAFCSVRASWKTPTTCWAEWHNLLGETMPVVELDGPPGWLQVIHGTNVSNRVRGTLTRPTVHRSRFPGALDDVDEPPPHRMLADQVVRGPIRVARDRARIIAKNTIVRLVGKDGLDRLKLRIGTLRGN